MAEVSNELMYEMLKRIQADLTSVKDSQRELRQDNLNIRNQIHSLQGDFNGLRGTMAQIQDRLDRIETRLELRDLAEPHRPYQPGC